MAAPKKAAVVSEEIVETPAEETVVETAVEEAPAPEVVEKTPEVADVEAPVAKEAAFKVKGDSVTVTWNGGSRVYSKEVHGADFAALAKEFASKHLSAVLS